MVSIDDIRKAESHKDKQMEKCNYCTESSPTGKCFWNLQTCRTPYCKEAIKNMTKNKRSSHLWD